MYIPEHAGSRGIAVTSTHISRLALGRDNKFTSARPIFAERTRQMNCTYRGRMHAGGEGRGETVRDATVRARVCLIATLITATSSLAARDAAQKRSTLEMHNSENARRIDIIAAAAACGHKASGRRGNL